MTRDILALPPVSRDECVRYGEDANQFFDLWCHAQPRAVAMMIHGGFWRAKYDLLHTSHLCLALAKSGVAVANIEYRRVGNAGGGWPGTYHDVQAAFSKLRQRFREEEKFIVLGHSAGGQLALRLAIDAPELTGVVALAPVAVLQRAYDFHLSNDAVVDFLGGTPDSMPHIYEAACPSRHPAKVRRILVHGTKDETVPLSISEEFCARRRHDIGVVSEARVSGAKHFDLVDPESNAWKTVHAAVDSLL